MRVPDLSSGAGHVVVTGASGRYLNPLREREMMLWAYTHFRLIKLHVAGALPYSVSHH